MTRKAHSRRSVRVVQAVKHRVSTSESLTPVASVEAIDDWSWWKDPELVFAILLFPSILLLCGLGVLITAIVGG